MRDADKSEKEIFVFRNKVTTDMTDLSERHKAALLFSNEAFYVAFAAGDADQMGEIWARDFSVSCIHPWREPIMGRENVMRSWMGILANSPHVTHHSPKVFGRGDMGYVICYEQIGHVPLLATNVFLLEDGKWKITHHQAGPTEASPPIKPIKPKFSN